MRSAPVVMAFPVVLFAFAPTLQAAEAFSNKIPFVNVRDFGAHPDNEDNTREIQQAVDTGKKAVVPPGSYAVNGTVVIGEAECLHLAHGAWLRRLADQSQNTEPVVRLTGNFPRLTGEGEACGVSSENASGGRTGDDMIHNGVINVGPVRAQDYTNINFWVIDSICVSGSSAAWEAYGKQPYPDDVDQNELVTLVNGAALSAGRGSCYLGRVSHCLFRYGGVAIKANPVCNGNMFTNNHFYRITHSCYFSDNTTENLFTNCFVHGDPGVTVIRLRKTGYNHCYGVMAEPGPTAPNGRYTRFCNISADSGQNVIIGHGNTGHSYINNSESSLVISHAQLSHGRAASFGSVTAGSLSADSVTALEFSSPEEAKSSGQHHEVFIKTFQPSNPTEFQDVLQLTCDSENQVFMIELAVTSSHASTSNHSSAKYIISGKRGSDRLASASVDLIGGNDAIQCRTVVQQNKVIVQLKPSYYLHGQFIVRINTTSSGHTDLTQL